MLPSKKAPWLVLGFVGLFAGASCAEGTETLVPPDGEDCPDGQERCAGECVDTEANDLHCGECDAACGPQLDCVDGQCVPACPTGYLDCNESCTSILIDAANCGSCGNVCNPEQVCVNAKCTCPLGQTECGDECVDTMTSEEHCGNCDMPCTGMNQACINGTCGLDCASFGLELCGGQCIDTAMDPLNCGSCGYVCGPAYDCINGDCSCQMATCNLCGITALGSSLPQMASGNTTPNENNAEPPCGEGGSPESVYSFVAPADGQYAISVEAQFLTAVYVYDANGCGQLGCQTAFFEPLNMILDLQQNQEILIVVDGAFAGEQGQFTLTVQEPPPCPANVIPPGLPQTLTGDTTLDPTFYSSPFCGGNGPETSWELTAPATGTFVFDTFGSGFDTLLYARNGSCAGFEIQCNDNAGMGFESQLLLDLTQGQTVEIFVDSWFSGGPYVLNVAQAGPCPQQVLPSAAPQTVTGNTAGGEALRISNCGGTGPEASYSFVAPNNGIYQFDTFGSAIDTVLYAHNFSCSGFELACNDDSGGPQSSLSLNLSQGQQVTLFVDTNGLGGAYTLNISEIVCPAIALPSVVPQTVSGDNSGGSNAFTSFCGGVGPEISYEFTAPYSGAFQFDTFGSPTDTVLYLRDTTCSGFDVTCNDDAGGPQSSVGLAMQQGQTVVIFVDTNLGGGPFTLNITEIPCPQLTLPSVAPQTVNGDTSPYGDAFQGFCGGFGGKDVSYEFTAPMTAMYTFDTNGTFWDTVLYIRDQNCGGQELDCNDDFLNLQSQVSAFLTQGQTIVIFMDGYSDFEYGPFTLHIN
jgi:hypothetical protein